MPKIPRHLIHEMISHAREDLPNEACGMVHASDGVPSSVHRVTNTAASPYRYDMAPLEVVQLDKLLGPQRRRVVKGQAGAGRFAAGFVEETLFAIYHSHVASEAWPSPTDVRQAFWPPGEIAGTLMFPDVYYVVISLAEEPPLFRVFRIRAADVIEDCIEPIEFELT